MYKRLTVVRLKELCSSRGIDCDNLRYKRDFVHVLQRYDAANDGVYDDEDNEFGANAASVRQEQASISDVEGEEGDQDTGDGGFKETIMRSPLATRQTHGETASQKQSYLCDFVWLWHNKTERLRRKSDG